MIHLLLDAAADALRLFLYSVRLMAFEPGAADEDVLYRHQVATACAEAGRDRTERFICMKIARFESFYRRDVGSCEVRGKAGEVSAWQILSRGKSDDERLCKSLKQDAEVMLERVRESRNACRSLPPEESLAIYTRGSCASEEGRKLSKVRWPSEVILK